MYYVLFLPPSVALFCHGLRGVRELLPRREHDCESVAAEGGVPLLRGDAELPGRGVGLRQLLLEREGPADVQQREPAFGSPVNF